jgi:hypothetical protein
MLKSIGRSSHFGRKLLAALSPRSHFTARLFISLFIAPFGAAMAAGAELAGRTMHLSH